MSKRRDWESVISDLESSGLSQAEYSRRSGIREQRLSYWKCRLSKSKEEPRGEFVELETKKEESVVELVFPNGIVARVSETTSVELIGNLRQALGC